MTPEQRDIVLIPVPFSDLSSSKRRPVLVLSKTAYNRGSSDVLVAAITSNIISSAPGVIITSSDLLAGGLPLDSLVRVDKLYTLSRGIIIKRNGKLRPEAFEQILSALDDLLGR
jgi:mRNA interferase MazF